MDQASTLILAASGFLDNACIGCRCAALLGVACPSARLHLPCPLIVHRSGGAVFSSCTTFIGDTEFYNNSLIPDEQARGTANPVISGSALRGAQVRQS